MRQSESLPEKRLKYIEPVAGLFHFQMRVLNMMFHAHGEGFNYWMKRLRRDARMWDEATLDIKDFRQSDAFFNHLLDGHIIAAFASKAGIKDFKELEGKIENMNWRKVIKTVADEFGNLGLVEGMRSAELHQVGERDKVYEDAVLLLQHGLMYRDFSQAIKCGDSGRIELCLQFFAVWFQATGMTNYAQESLHFIACLKHIWHPDLRLFWRDNCLVNITGSRNSFLPCDLLGEYVVREIKDMIHHNVNPATDNYLRTVLARLVMHLRCIRENFYRTVGAAEQGQHSSIVSAEVDVSTIASELMKQHAFDFIKDRVSPLVTGGPDFANAVDLHGLGIGEICAGEPIEKYKQSIKKDMFPAQYENDPLDYRLDMESDEDDIC